MFLVGDGRDRIEQKIRHLFASEPSVGLVIAAVYFEWSICRALMCLSTSPNKELRSSIEKAHGLRAYKDIWAREVMNGTQLPVLVKAWHTLTQAFDARNLLVHGRDRYTRNMAAPHLEVLLAAVANVWDYCARAGYDLSKRLPVRRKTRERRK